MAVCKAVGLEKYSPPRYIGIMQYVGLLSIPSLFKI